VIGSFMFLLAMAIVLVVEAFRWRREART
jgi:hypothetical protein